MRRHGWIFLIFLVSCQSSALQTETKPALHPVLKEARDHVVVLPEKSLTIQRENLDLLGSLSSKEIVIWHMTTLKAALPVSDLDAMSQAFIDVLPYQEHETFTEYRAFYLNSLGAWMRRNGHYDNARLAYFCSTDLALQNQDRLKSLMNLAIVERNQGNRNDARALNFVALNIAELEKQGAMVATIENNLGILALTSGELDAASDHFKKSLDLNRQLVRRGSEILAGINLLHTFVKQEEYLLYERLYPRIDRLTDRFGQNARSAYLDWIHSVYLHRTENPISFDEKARLAERFNKLNDAGIKKMLFPFTAELAIEVEVPDDIQQLTYEGELMSQINFCDWSAYQGMSYDTLLDKIGHYLSEKSTL